MRGYFCNLLFGSQGRQGEDPVPGATELVTVIKNGFEIGRVDKVTIREEGYDGFMQRGAEHNVCNIHPVKTRWKFSYD